MGNILIVDDSLLILEATKEILSKHNHAVDTAKNGSEALEKIKSHNFDLVLLDISMPGMDGFETCKQLRADDKYKLLPVVVYYTEAEETSVKVKGLDTGASDFIVKSYAYEKPAEFIARVNSQLKIAEQTRQIIELERLRLLRQSAVTLTLEINAPMNAISLGVKLMANDNPKSSLYYDEITANIEKINTILRKLSRALNTETINIDNETMINVARILKKG